MFLQKEAVCTFPTSFKNIKYAETGLNKLPLHDSVPCTVFLIAVGPGLLSVLAMVQICPL